MFSTSFRKKKDRTSVGCFVYWPHVLNLFLTVCSGSCACDWYCMVAGIVSLSGTDFSKDIMDQGVDADRRMLDFLVGLDTEFSGELILI